MKRIFIITAALAAFMGLPAAAQNLEAGAEANSASLSASQASSGSIATGGSITFNQPGEITTRQEGTARARLENVPSLGSLALGGGHPCAYAPATAQIAIVGGGIGAGGMRVDEACMLMVMGASAKDARAYSAAYHMIGARSPEACIAMWKAGMVADCRNKRGKSIVGNMTRDTTTHAKVATVRPKARPVSLDVECRRNGNTIVPVVSKTVLDHYGAEAVKNACR